MFRIGVEQSSRGILRGCGAPVRPHPMPLSHEGRGGLLPGEYQEIPLHPNSERLQQDVRVQNI